MHKNEIAGKLAVMNVTVYLFDQNSLIKTMAKSSIEIPE
jgi:hypothetical protein